MIKLRGRQPEWIETIEKDLISYSRLLVVAPGGVGKTSVMGVLAARHWERGIRTLILENRDRLTEQTAERIRSETGLDVDIEKGDSRASPYAPIVVGSVQSLGRANRLTGFSDSHFGLVIPDECHLALAPQWRRIIDHFNIGAESLVDGWKRPADGTYSPKCKVVGFTASPDLGDRRNLGEIFQHISVNYSYLDAISDGWLVGIEERNIPIRLDTRKLRVKRTAEGADFSAEDQSAMLIPVIKELAKQLVENASDKKTMCFVPSVECARLMAEAINALGLKAYFVSGECIDRNEKTDAFQVAGPGTVLVNCSLYCYGVDFPDVSCIAPFGAIISKVKYIQILYRGTRVLPGTVSDEMTAEQRIEAIARSSKKDLLVLSPFFISEKIHIMEVYDLFGVPPPDKADRKKPDFTKPAEVRDYIAALEKAADKHRNKQARTVNPVSFALSIGERALATYEPQTTAEAAPPSREVLDFLLDKGISTIDVKTAGQANKLVDRLRERDRLGLASPKQLQQLLLRFGMDEETAMTMKAGKAGLIICGKIPATRRPTPASPPSPVPHGP